MFRSPPNVRVGRRALEPEVIEALEHTHPDLTFDWTTLLREPPPPRFEARERPGRSGRSSRQTRAATDTGQVIAAVVDDHSLLGRVLGADQASRLRARYQELLQRIARRATTPEQRDRLTERAVRLNPDEWPDEGAVRAGSRTIESDWGAIAEELPQRRRGRRGGRNRAVQPESAGPAASEIMASNGESRGDDSEARRADHDRGSDDAGRRGPVSPDSVDPAAPGTTADVPGDD
jgi:hypothetical protein